MTSDVADIVTSEVADIVTSEVADIVTSEVIEKNLQSFELRYPMFLCKKRYNYSK